jgi:hypothetical protein
MMPQPTSVRPTAPVHQENIPLISVSQNTSSNPPYPIGDPKMPMPVPSGNYN